MLKRTQRIPRSFLGFATLLGCALSNSGCGGDGGQIHATANIRFEVPDEVTADAEYPLLVTLSAGWEGKEENNSSESTQKTLIFCEPLDPFVYHDSISLDADCKREDFYVRVTLRRVTLNDPSDCDQADSDGVLFLPEADYTADNRVLAEDGMLAWDKKDCGNQYSEFDLELVPLD
jgi:hypothetical protein